MKIMIYIASQNQLNKQQAGMFKKLFHVKQIAEYKINI